jgi:hypothetical protein
MPKFRGDDPRRDLTDLCVFVSPQSPGTRALSFGVNPFSPFFADANEFNATAPADDRANYQVRRECAATYAC